MLETAYLLIFYRRSLIVLTFSIATYPVCGLWLLLNRDLVMRVIEFFMLVHTTWFVTLRSAIILITKYDSYQLGPVSKNLVQPSYVDYLLYSGNP